MKRVSFPPRADWRQQVIDNGLIYLPTFLSDGTTRDYWNEGVAYTFSVDEVRFLEDAVAELHAMHEVAAQHVLDHDLTSRLAIPDWCVPAIRASWDDRFPTVYGRFDLAYDREHVKLLEYNADTPTALFESAYVQLAWLYDLQGELPEQTDQWNVLDDALVGCWKELAGSFDGDLVHFAYMNEPTGEDIMNTSYLATTAERAGLRTVLLEFAALDLDANGHIVDPDGERVRAIFKLYPWEWMVDLPAAELIFDTALERTVTWIEPPYKMLWSNKGILPVLWELFPDHPHLLPAYFDEPGGMEDYVRKPMLSREGSNITIVRHGTEVLAIDGPYGSEGFVCQAYVDIPTFETPDGHATPCLGAWLVQGAPAGLAVRESYGPITDNLSRFTPHVVLPSVEG
ncbi:MAG: glutathionylspermidine synthase family protein [Actinobacteria bacterium]|nr:glutathionylspermidine synthase family protein [Actinomycetota bacterium]